MDLPHPSPDEVLGAWVSSTTATSFGGMKVYVASAIAGERKSAQEIVRPWIMQLGAWILE